MPINAWSVIEDLGSEYRLFWPPDIFKSEVISMLREERESDLAWTAHQLLIEAFEDEAVWREFSQLPNDVSWDYAPGAMTKKKYLHFLVDNAEALHSRKANSPYWLDRKGLAPVPPETGNQKTLQVAWVTLVQDLIEKGYFSNFAPNPCVKDDGDSLGVDEKLDDLVERKLRIPSLWQRALDDSLEDDYLFALMEVFHDLVSRPRIKMAHNHKGCGWHFDKQVTTTGQRVYRWKVNSLLKEYRTALKLDRQGDNMGRLVNTVDDPRANLISRVVAKAGPEIKGTTEHAIALFERRGSSRAEKRSACVALARVLEDRRKLIKQQMLNADEGLLFEMANKFDLRHRDGKQHENYADDYLDWIFWIYLSTVELTNRLISSQQKVAKPNGVTVSHGIAQAT